jgi:hypothetical protein
MRVHDDRNRVRRQLAQVIEDLATLLVARSRVDDQRLATTQHHPDLLVEYGISAREDTIAKLDPGARSRSHAADRSG